MPIDFAKLLSPEARARLAFERTEIRRLYQLENRFLAEALLKMSREVLDSHPRLLPYNGVYDDTFFWHAVPEIARRLGARQFRSNERTDAEITMMQDAELRHLAGSCIANISSRDYRSLLLHEPINGNPVAFALDRLSPPINLATDPIARRMIGPAASRKVKFEGVWTPSLMEYGERSKNDNAPIEPEHVENKRRASITTLRR